jgi:futalosine hydrolase
MPRMNDPRALLLVPTELELEELRELGGFPAGAARVELCGFGPVAAAARTAQLVARHSPAQVLLVGIAGTYESARLPLGAATSFREAALEGATARGFPLWPARDGRPAIHARLALQPASDAGAALLLTVGSASASAAEGALRRAPVPEAAAEDMEGFGVALACALSGLPCTIVRGISNTVGERDHARWRIRDALAAARTLALAQLAAGAGT